MECQISGEIQCKYVSASRPLRRFTDKQIKNWIKNQFAQARINAAQYRVEITRKGSGHTFDCHIEVHAGERTWVGRHYRMGLHQALIQCLQNMMPAPSAVPA